ncbi:MAG: hypothetical protein IJ058_10300 [Lachnospiraceae bacterium]|nr:hypothetical protein [Lachnospiraceae bacterium]
MKHKKIKKFNRIVTLICVLMMAFSLGTVTAKADITLDTSADGNGKDRIDDLNRSDADADLYHYMNSLMVQYELNETQYNRMQDLFNSAVYYIANTDMTVAQLETYVASVKSQMNTVATTDVTPVTSEYLQVDDNWSTPNVSYGERVSIVLPVINLGTEELNDLVIEPEVSNDVTKWPFVPGSTGYIQTEPFIPGYINDQQAHDNRREFTYNFTVRSDVMTGYYELKFRVSYTRAGVRVEDDNAAELTVFVHTYGKPESGFIGGNGNEDKKPKSRIIVTGYDTNPKEIYSGDTFDLTLHVQNTSTSSAVSNVLFDLKAAAEQVSTNESIIPFIPTSGSNAVYVSDIPAGSTTDINIEMNARAGLSQKSYVLELNMTYDSGIQFDLTDKASISIPVLQESKFDMSTVEVAPASINVGGQSNVMFSLYNTGKTTLYNVQVQFAADSIENNMAYIGNLSSGSTGNVDVMLTGVSQTMDDGTVNLKISYEDEAGNVTTADKTCTLFVNEIMMDDFGMDGRREPGMEEEDTSGGIGAVMRGLIIGAAVILIFGIGAFIYVRRKKKKEASLHAEDLKDLEELEKDDTDGTDELDNGSDENNADNSPADNGPVE